MPRRRHHRFAKDGSSRAYVNGQGNANDRLPRSHKEVHQENTLVSTIRLSLPLEDKNLDQQLLLDPNLLVPSTILHHTGQDSERRQTTPLLLPQTPSATATSPLNPSSGRRLHDQAQTSGS